MESKPGTYEEHPTDGAESSLASMIEEALP